MTRINLVDPGMLHDKHLLAEYRELPRVYGLVRDAIARGWTPDDPRIPGEFLLGKGHVTFFYNKLGWLNDRFDRLVYEGIRVRGWALRHTAPPDHDIPLWWFRMWEPRWQDIQLSTARILERMPKERT